MTRLSLHRLLLVSVLVIGCDKGKTESPPVEQPQADASVQAPPTQAESPPSAEAKADGAKNNDGLAGTAMAIRVDKQLESARVLTLNGKSDEAAGIIESILEGEPEHPEATVLLGKIRLEQERWAEAETLLQKATDAKPDEVEGWVALGRARMELDDAKGAAEAYAKAHALEEQDAEVLQAFGKATLKAGDAGKAETLLAEAAQIDPRLPHVYTALGDALLEQGKHEDALKSYMKAQNAYRSDRMARAGAALTYEAMGDDQHAIDEWSAYIRMDCCSEYSKDVAQPKLMSLAK